MTLREEIIKLSGEEELLSEEVLEEMVDWAVPLVQAGAKVFQTLAPMVNWGANVVRQYPGIAAASGAALVSLGTVADVLINKREKAKRAVQYLKVSEGDKEQLVKVADSDMSDKAKKSWIFRILEKYATKAKNAVNKVKNNIQQEVQAEKDYRQEKRNIKNFKAEKKQKEKDEKNAKKYIKRNFGDEEGYKEYQDWKSKQEL